MLLRYAVYPALVFTASAIVILVQTTGLGYWPVVPLTLVFAALIVASLERAIPFARAWNADARDTRTDVAHLIGNVAVSQLSLVGYAATRTVWDGTGMWPTAWPFWTQAILGLAIVDAGLYTVHRASHGVGWLWRLHAIHHSARRVYWMNGQRRHLVHELLEGAPGLLLLFVLGAPVAVYASAIAIVTVHLLLQHANIEYRLGPLSRLFAGAETHRWHHQRKWEDVQGNYGAVFAVWDHAFGTALPQHGDAPLDVGMDDEPDLPSSYTGQLAWPFKARRD